MFHCLTKLLTHFTFANICSFQYLCSIIFGIQCLVLWRNYPLFSIFPSVSQTSLFYQTHLRNWACFHLDFSPEERNRSSVWKYWILFEISEYRQNPGVQYMPYPDNFRTEDKNWKLYWFFLTRRIMVKKETELSLYSQEFLRMKSVHYHTFLTP